MSQQEGHAGLDQHRSGSAPADTAPVDRLLYAAALGEGVGRLRFAALIEAEFREEYFLRNRARMRNGFLLAIGLYLAFLSIRLMTESGPAAQWGLALRVTIIVAMTAAVIASYRMGRVGLTRVVVATYLTFGAGVTAIECVAAHYGIDRRYEGLIFITFHCYVFTLLLFRTALGTAAAIFLIYAAGGWLGGLLGKSFGYELFFLVLINILGAVALYSRESAERENFLRRRILQQIAPAPA